MKLEYRYDESTLNEYERSRFERLKSLLKLENYQEIEENTYVLKDTGNYEYERFFALMGVLQNKKWFTDNVIVFNVSFDKENITKIDGMKKLQEYREKGWMD